MAGRMLVIVLSMEQAFASWFTDDRFPSPSNWDNHCTEQQKVSWNFSSLTPGQPISHFDRYVFSNFAGSYHSRREITPPSDRGITTHIAKLSSRMVTPQIHGGEDQPLFSITAFHVYTEQETDVTFEYAMPDGSTCRHTAPCHPEGSTVRNHQCGGAMSVTWWIPETSPVTSCELGLLAVDFDCNPRPAPSTPWLQLPTLTAAVIPPVATDRSASSSPVVAATIAATSTSGWEMRHNTTTTPWRSSSPDLGCASVGLPCRPSSPTIGTQAMAVSPTITSDVALHSDSTAASAVPCTLTSMASESFAMSSAWSPTPISFSSTAMGSGTNVTTVGSAMSGLAPKCINTWLTDACIDNTHASCYCPSRTMVTNIVECIQAWGVHAREISTALSCLMGICIEYVGQNPAILTAAPTLTTSVAAGLGLAGILPPMFETIVTRSSALYTIPRVAFTTILDSDLPGTRSPAEVGLTLIPLTVSASTLTSSPSTVIVTASGTIHETGHIPSISPPLMAVTAGSNSPLGVWPSQIAWLAGLWIFVVLV